MNQSLKKAIVYLLAAYFVTTMFGALLSIILGYTLGLPSYIEAGVKPSQSPAYKVTEPFQPLLCLIVYSFFAYRLLRDAATENLQSEALRLSTIGLIGSILIDFVSFVLIPHPYAFTFKEFYIGYQPWIMIIYTVILVSPILTMYLLKRKENP
jgi:cation transport ATPase